MTPVLILAGPTASGKSAAALALARAIGGEIVNADAMQVYEGLRILTARPSECEERVLPHHLYGHVPPEERYSAGRFAREAAGAISGIRSRGHVPVVVGGTGLYLRALTQGLSPVPDIPAERVRDAERAWEADPEGVRAALIARDPAAGALVPADRQRHVRALSVLEATGRPLSSWQKEPPSRLTEGPFRAAVLSPPRDALYDRIERRFDAMIEAGALGELRALLARDLPPGLPLLKALGVPELAAHLRGELALEEAVSAAKRATRRFAKRQLTWFRGQTDWPLFEDGAAAADHLAQSVSARSSA
ncbi:tRNA (adenosine(37)-N6)-dimethylallyltransferase MiaA [Parvularcula oceani]|uniref:tRNA (adenosine(37)-N6)-dimethylallyltransferase MiaA n=1 Tax=Parvularcula oceani TaxID=1247963 RepID=UPI0004E27DD2|nr:tRNA (adenosine(37)-N6)-dimethylallyltransferase MiaA [Parvularcula oceani]